ncbi:MAG: DUF1552 domain-containing protein [Polyangia bacterium]
MSVSSKVATRRNFLRAASGAALALPLLEGRRGFAQSAASVPTRLVIYQTGEGNLQKRWTPTAMPGDALQLSEMLQPLLAHQKKLLVLSGVSNKVARLHSSNCHNAAGHTLMTSSLIDSTGTGRFDAKVMVDSGSLCLGPSIDAYLADQLKIPAPINLAVGNSSPAENQMFYKMKPSGSAGANPVAPLSNDPIKTFKTYLAGLPAGTTPTPPPATRADRFQAQRTSVLDQVWTSFKSLNANVGKADSLRLQAHADATRAIEQKSSYVVPATCGGQTQAVPANWTQPRSPGFVGADVQANLMIDVMAGILACGANRVITLQDTLYDEARFEFLPVGPVSGWHAQVHNDPALKLGYASNNDNPTLKAGFLYYAGVFNRLLSKMDAVVEPNGMTMLDNSLVLWISEFGTGQNHSMTNLPVVLAGGLQGKVKMNRYLDRPSATLGDLYTSILNAFGIPATSFGHNDGAGFNNGVISGLVS